MKNNLENAALRMTKFVGSVWSLMLHTVVFISCGALIAFGYNAEKVMLALTTFVSLEAIYFSIFIQMTVNKNTEAINNISEDVAEVQEDVEEITEDVHDIQEDIKDVQEDIEEIQEDIEQIEEGVDELVEDETETKK